MSELEPLLHADEAIDDLHCSHLKIIQARNGYRFSIDPVLLCAFTRLNQGMRVVDLGTGNGVIPSILASRIESLQIVGLERQASMADRARRCARLNNLQDRIQIIEGDVRELPESMAGERFDAALMNPPYRAPSSGRIAADGERAAARHELAGSITDFLQAAARLLNRNGLIYVVFLAERLAGLLSEMRRFNLEPKRLRMVHPRRRQAAKLILVEGRKNGKPGLEIEPPLFIYRGAGRDYTAEVLKMYK